MKRKEMKQNYERLRNEWRDKYGVFSLEKVKGSENDELIQDTAGLLLALGEYRATHRSAVKNRQYQRAYYHRNIDKKRLYQRTWVRAKRRAMQ